MISLLVYLLIVVIILGLVWWAIGALGIPEPFNKIARVIVVIIAVLVFIYVLLALVGGVVPPLKL